MEFDAVYNASLWPSKRHELAFEIPRVAYITYYYDVLGTKAGVQTRLELLRNPPAGHQLVNPVVEDLSVLIPPEAVNEVYGRAAVGLCIGLILHHALNNIIKAAITHLLASSELGPGADIQ